LTLKRARLDPGVTLDLALDLFNGRSPQRRETERNLPRDFTGIALEVEDTYGRPKHKIR